MSKWVRHLAHGSDRLCFREGGHEEQDSSSHMIVMLRQARGEARHGSSQDVFS